MKPPLNKEVRQVTMQNASYYTIRTANIRIKFYTSIKNAKKVALNAYFVKKALSLPRN